MEISRPSTNALMPPKEKCVSVGGVDLWMLVEPLREGFTYGCSVSDVVQVLSRAADLAPCLPDIVAFRQPTRKQRQQNPVWGRFIYFGEFGKHKGKAILLEAQGLGASLRLSKRMTLADRDEFDRLVMDGHVFDDEHRYYRAELHEDAVRNTMLYRTLLHELGHLAHYHYEVLNRPTALDEDRSVADDLYFSKPVSEREVYAHAFATRLRKALQKGGKIPL